GLAMRRMALIESAGHLTAGLLGMVAVGTVAVVVGWQARSRLIPGGHTSAVLAGVLGALAGYAATVAINPVRRRRGAVLAALALAGSVPLTGVRTTATLVVT